MPNSRGASLKSRKNPCNQGWQRLPPHEHHRLRSQYRRVPLVAGALLGRPESLFARIPNLRHSKVATSRSSLESTVSFLFLHGCTSSLVGIIDRHRGSGKRGGAALAIPGSERGNAFRRKRSQAATSLWALAS